MKRTKRARSQAFSAICVARLLNAEGFSPHVANEVKRYALNALATRDQKRRWKRAQQAFREIIRPKLNEADCALLGKFIAFMKKMSFDTGLRIGLATTLFGGRVNEDEIEGLGQLDEAGDDGTGPRGQFGGHRE